MQKKNFYFVSVLLILSSCSTKLSEQNKTQTQFKSNGSISLSSSNAGAKSQDDYSSTSTSGTWCEFPAKRVYAFVCGKENPGIGWVVQADGCYHSVTPQGCSCEVSKDWINQATKTCVGKNMEMRDSCGYLKKLENTVACGGSGSDSGSVGGSGTPTVAKLSCEEARFTKLINLYRQSKGMGALQVSIAGVTASRWHAKDMIDKGYFSHTEPNGRNFNSRAGAFGFGAAAENIAAGNGDAGATFCKWKTSPGHNQNMLSHFSVMGIGNVSGGGAYGTYWVNIFGSGADIISEPLTNEGGCAMPTSLPGC